MTDPIDWSKVYAQQACEAESMGNVASGYQWYELANRMWAFANWLRTKAKQARTVETPNDTP